MYVIISSHLHECVPMCICTDLVLQWRERCRAIVRSHLDVVDRLLCDLECLREEWRFPFWDWFSIEGRIRSQDPKHFYELSLPSQRHSSRGSNIQCECTNVESWRCCYTTMVQAKLSKTAWLRCGYPIWVLQVVSILHLIEWGCIHEAHLHGDGVIVESDVLEDVIQATGGLVVREFIDCRCICWR